MRPCGWCLLAPTLLAACSSSTSSTSPVDAAIRTDAHTARSRTVLSGTGTGTGTATESSSIDTGHFTGSSGNPLPVDAGPVSDGGLVTFGGEYDGGVYNLGPVDYSESAFHNACAPGTKYDPRVQAVEGTMLAGLWGNIPNVAGYCDACITMLTAKGKTALLRVVTYGETTPNSVDLSPNAYAALNENEYPRAMQWEFAECPDTGPILYEFQTESSQWWTSLWVRNARVPLTSVEVESPNHATWAPLTRGGDGTLTDTAGFGQGSFTIRSTGVDGQVVSDTFAWPAAGLGGAFLTGKGNFE